MTYPNCPVCGYAQMPYPPMPYNICPCCGTEFGVDDREKDHESLRQAWVKLGKPWFDDISCPPVGWNPDMQLMRAGLGYIPLTLTIIGEGSENKEETVSVVRVLWATRDLQRFSITNQTAA